MGIFETTGIILRAKRAWGIDSDVQLARILGVGKSTLSNWKKRNTIDFDILFSKCKHINPSWLLNEVGPIFLYDEIDTNNFRAPLVRISMLIVENKSNVLEFEKAAKIKGGEFLFVNALLNSTEEIVGGWVGSAKTVFPNCSIKWILSGEGEMMEGQKVIADNTFTLRTDRNLEDQTIPLYDFEAAAGLVAIFNEHGVEPVDFLKIPNLPAVDGAIYVRGESMYPLLKSGDIVMYKKKELSMNSILWGEIYLLSFDSDGDTYTTVKYLRKSDQEGMVRLVSFNPDYAPKDIPLSSITALALVKASLSFHTME